MRYHFLLALALVLAPLSGALAQTGQASGMSLLPNGALTTRTLANRAAGCDAAGTNCATFDAKDYGLSPSASAAANRTALAAVSAAVCSAGKGVINIPAGTYFIDTTGGEILVACEGYWVVGAGDQATTLGLSGTNNLFHVTTTGGVGGYGGFSGFRTYRTDNPSAGAVIQLDHTLMETLNNLEITGSYTAIDCISCGQTYGSNLQLDGNNSASGSRFMWQRRASNVDASHPYENFYSNVNARSGTQGSYTNAVLVNASDGLWFVNSHIGFTSGAAVLVTPGFVTDLMANLVFTGTVFDEPLGACIDYEPLALYTGSNVNLNVAGGTCGGGGADGFKFNDPAFNGGAFSGVSVGSVQGRGWNILAGTRFAISGGTSALVNLNNGGNPDIYVGGTATHVAISGMSLVSSVPNNIQIADAADYVVVNLNDYGGAASGWVANTSSGVHNQVVTRTAYYTGPGELNSGASAFWGLRAYSSTQALSGANVANITRASDGTSSDIKVLSDGTFDAASAATFCNATTCTIHELYDQTGNGYDLIQATGGSQPALTFNCIGTLPCMTFTATKYLSSASAPTVTQPVSLSIVAERTGLLTTQTYLFATKGDLATAGFRNTNNTWSMYAGGPGQVTATAADTAWHIAEDLYSSGSSIINIDNLTPTTANAGANGIGTSFVMGGLAAGTNGITGNIAEIGVWPTDITTAGRANQCHNAYVFWGTSVAC